MKCQSAHNGTDIQSILDSGFRRNDGRERPHSIRHPGENRGPVSGLAKTINVISTKGAMSSYLWYPRLHLLVERLNL